VIVIVFNASENAWRLLYKQDTLPVRTLQEGDSPRLLKSTAIMGRWELFYDKWFGPALPVTTRDLTGRIVVITGANVGLGFEAAKHFYAMKPARLILAVRNMSKGEEAKKAIITADNGSSPTQVDVWQLDLSSFDSTKAFAAKVNEELDRLDVFLANAAIAGVPWSQTTDGWEST
jgi:retinol dehydrogenase 12